MKNDNNTDNNNPNSKLNNKGTTGQPFTSLREPTPELKEELSSIMASPKKKFLIFGLLGLLLSYLLFYFFVLRKRNPTNTQVTTNEVVGGVTPYSVVDETPGLPSLPAIPKIEAPVFIHDTTASEKIAPPTPPLPPIPEPPKVKVVKPEVVVPPVVVMPSTPITSTTTTAVPAANPNDPAAQRAETKRKSGIMLMSGKPPEKTPEEIKQDVDFTNRGNTCLLLPRGKIIEAVIETAVSTDFGGEVRALVTRDVYAASGNRILIPKGSVAIGRYETGFDGIYARIKINWFRIDLANNNYSINISSPSVDNLGREGITGKLDNRYKEKLGNVILTSAFDILLAKGLDKLIPPVVNSSVATANQAIASQLNNIALGIYGDTTKTPSTKISLICAQIQSVIPDKTSQAFITFATTCNNLMVNPTGGNPQQTLDSLMASVSSTSASLIANVTTQVTPTQAQQASKQAFIDIAHTLRELTTRELPKATVTIDQGTHVKIYVNKDYNFPAAALSKVVRLK